MESRQRLLACQRDTRLRCLLADAIREHLVDRYAGLDDGSLLDFGAVEQASRLGGMNAMPRGPLMEQAMTHIDLVLDRLERLQRLAELHLRPRTLGAPVILIHAVPHEEHGEALGKLLGGR